VSTSGVQSVKTGSRFVITRGQKAVRYGELYVHPLHTQSEVESERLKIKRYSSSWETPPQSYATSPVMWDHTVLPANRHRWTRPA